MPWGEGVACVQWATCVQCARVVEGHGLHRGCAKGSRQPGVPGEGRGLGSCRPSCKPFGRGTSMVHWVLALLGSGLSRPNGVLGPNQA